MTTRVAPRALGLVEPSRQMKLNIEDGLESPYAENILRELDVDGKLGLKSAPDGQLALARQRTRGFPRALEALYAILAADRNTSLEEILSATSGERRDHVTHALVGATFNRLDCTQQRVMQALAVYGRPVPPAAVDYLLQPYQDGIDSAPVLGRLVNMHFAREEAGRYFLHPVDREYALARLAVGVGTDRDRHEGAPSDQALVRRAADYFKAIRLPREAWKTIEDHAPHLAEFDLRVESHDTEAAARVLEDIAFEYLMPWGWSRFVVESTERVSGPLRDAALRSRILNIQGVGHYNLGELTAAIDCHEQALTIDRVHGDRYAEVASLGDLANCRRAIGQVAEAFEVLEQALKISKTSR